MKSFLLQLFSWGLPWRIRRFILVRILGYKLAPTAKIGLSIVRAQSVEMGNNARIGHLNFITKLERLVVGDEACISNLNYIYGVPKEPGVLVTVASRESSLIVKEHAAITSRHLVDCTDCVTLEPFATLAGYRSTLLTHSVQFRQNIQTCGPITIGHHSFVGTNCVLLKGTKVPPRSLVAAGTVFTDKEFEPNSMLGGVPVKKIGEVDDSWEHFNRTCGRVQ